MKRFAIFLLICLTFLIVCGESKAAAPTFVSKLGEVTLADAAVNTNTFTVSITPTSGSDRELLISLGYRTSGVTITSCVFNTTETATQVALSASGALNQAILKLANPTVTTANMVCTLSANVSTGRLTVYQYNGVGNIGASNTNSGSNNNPTVSVTTTTADSLVLAAYYDASQTASPFTPAGGVTERTDGTTGADTTLDRSFTDTEMPATTVGSYTPSTTGSAANSWVAAIAEIQAVATTPTGPGLLTLLHTGGPGGGGTPPPATTCTIEMSPGSGDTQVAAQMAAAPTDAEICLALGETVVISNTLTMDISNRNLSFNCQGSVLQRNKTGPLIVMQGAEIGTSPFTISGNTITWTTIPTGLAVGDYVKLTADDDLPGASHTSTTLRARLGQAVPIVSVNSGAGTSGFSGTLNFSSSYLTNKRGNKITSKVGKIKNCNITGNVGQVTWVEPSIQVRNAINPIVDRVHCVNGLAGCVDFINTVNASLSNTDCRDLLSSSSGQNYCGHADSSLGTQVTGIYAENTRQPFAASSTDILANTTSLANYGAVWNLTLLDSVCRNATGPLGCWGLDAEVQFANLNGLAGFDSSRCASARGLNNTWQNSFCDNMTNGLELNDVSNSSAQGLLFNKFIEREVDNTALTVVGNPASNRICSSRFESYAAAESISDSTNLASCTYISGHATLFNTVLGSNVPINNQENYNYCQTCDDIIIAGAGDDTIDALGGNDFVWGGAGNDNITLGAGNDLLVYSLASEGLDTVSDFVAGNGGDIIDVSRFLASAASATYSGNPFADGYVSTTQSGGNCLVKLDLDGTSGPTSASTVASLTGVTCSDLNSSNWKTVLH